MRALILVVAVAAPLVTLLPGAFPVVDDGMNSWWMVQVEQRNPGFLAQLGAVVLEAAYGGHYRPTQDVIFVAAWELGGVTGWTRLALAVYVLMHAGSALLLAAILRSLGAGSGAWLAALAFGIHPVASAVFICAQFAHNVPGLFFTLLACWILLRPPRGLARNLGAATCVFLAAGSNPNWLISAPCAVALVAALHQGLPARRAWRSWLATIAFTGVAILAAAGLRVHASGALTTSHPGYSGPRNRPPLALQIKRSWDGVFALEPTPGTRLSNSTTHPPPDPAIHPSWIAVIIGVVAPLLLMLPTGPRPPPPPGSHRASVFGLGLAIISLAPYFLLVGFHGQNRYLYPAVAGLVAAPVLLIEWPLRSVMPTPWARWALVLVLCPALIFVASASLDSIASIRSAHRHARQALESLHREVDEAPQLRRVQVLGVVPCVGRAGFIYPHSMFLQGQLAAMVRRPNFTPSTPCALEDIASGGAPGVGAFRITTSGTVQRLSSPSELTFDELCIDFLDQWRRFWRDRSDHPIATIPSAELARVFVTVLGERVGPAEVFHLGKDLLEVRSGDLQPPGQGVGLLVPSTLSWIIRELSEYTRAVPFALRSLHASGGALPIVEAGLEVAERAAPDGALAILSSSAVARPDCRDQVRQIVRRRLPSLDHELFEEALDAEIDARELLASGDVDAAWRAFARAMDTYRAVGVRRPDSWLGKLRCDLLKGRSPEGMTKAFDHWKARGVPLAAEAPWASGARPSVSELKVLLARPVDGLATREQVELVAWLSNSASSHVPGGQAPYAASLRWEWSAKGRDSTLPAGTRSLPDHGVPCHSRIVLPCLVKGPGFAGRFQLRAILEIGDQAFVGELDVDCQ